MATAASAQTAVAAQTAALLPIARSATDHILFYMQILIELDDATYRRLELVAPAKSRARSAFIRAAIQKSLWELEEERTRRAYLDAPDDAPNMIDPEVWEPLAFGGFDPPKTRASTRKRSAKRARSRAQRK